MTRIPAWLKSTTWTRGIARIDVLRMPTAMRQKASAIVSISNIFKVPMIVPIKKPKYVKVPMQKCAET